MILAREAAAIDEISGSSCYLSTAKDHAVFDRSRAVNYVIRAMEAEAIDSKSGQFSTSNTAYAHDVLVSACTANPAIFPIAEEATTGRLCQRRSSWCNAQTAIDQTSVEMSCGLPSDQLIRDAEEIAANSGSSSFSIDANDHASLAKSVGLKSRIRLLD